eukprot:COSAG03_NODE_1840_length_3451_cov_6.463305_5_plen_144_part_00
MREFEWLVGLITGEDVELQRESWTVLRAAVGAVQQLHLDWDKEAMETILGAIDQQFWKRVYVMLYYPKGGTNVNGQGEVQLLKGGDMLLFDGYRYVHAAGPEVKGCVTRVLNRSKGLGNASYLYQLARTNGEPVRYFNSEIPR